MVQAQIDEQRGEVRVGDQRYRFELDCRSGTATLVLDDARLQLRSPSWREKRTLARFAGLDPSFVQAQFLQVCLVPVAAQALPLPAAGPARDALLALALWLDQPTGGVGLPLDRRMLASVTLQLCGALRSGPQTLDELDAIDVELLWDATREAAQQTAAASSSELAIAAAPPSPAPEGTRIMIVPDLEQPARAAQTHQLRKADRVAVVDHPRQGAANSSAADEPVRASGATATALFAQPSAAQPAVDSAGNQHDDEETTQVLVNATRATIAAEAPSRPRAAASGGRFRVELGDSRSAGAGTTSRVVLPMQTRGSDSLPPPSAASNGAQRALAPIDQPQPSVRLMPVVSRSVPVPAATDTEQLFAELGQRLEQTARELGIDLEH